MLWFISGVWLTHTSIESTYVNKDNFIAFQLRANIRFAHLILSSVVVRETLAAHTANIAV